MKKLSVIIVMLLLLTGFVPPAYSWGSAIHAYIGSKLEYKGILKANVIYGQMAADTFNFMFDAPLEQMQYFYAMTHGFPLDPNGEYSLDTVLPVLRLADTKREEAVAFGFVSHNNFNGADVTAHGVPYNNPEGYVIAKALELNEILKPLLWQAGIDDLPDEVLLEVSHTLVEYAADLLIRKYDRAIGARMITASITRDKGFPELLVKAYAQGFANTFGIPANKARLIIINEEAKFRRLMINYATILQYGDRRAQAEVTNFLAEIAPGFLGAYGIEIPSDVLLPVIQFGIEKALILCKDDLYPTVQTIINNLHAIDWFNL
jgi:hypothetical protein